MKPSDTPKAASASVAELMHQHIVRAAEMLTSYAELVKATGKYAEMHYIPEIEFIIGELMNMSTRLAAPAASAELQRWHLIDPTGAIAATECSCIRAWSRIDGYKPTVEGLLGYEEAGWRVAPAASAEPVAEVYRGGTNTFGRATVLNRWLDGAMELADGTHLLYAHPATGTAEPVESLCDDCPPVGYPTEKTRCLPCPRRVAAPHPATAAGEQELPALPEAVGEIVGTRLTPPETREFWGYWREGYTPTTKLRVVSVEAALAYGEACALAARRLPAGADETQLRAQLARSEIRGAAYEAAYAIAYHATFQSHSGHWDSTGQSGLGCPECIKAREAREHCDKALREGLQQLIDRAERLPAGGGEPDGDPHSDSAATIEQLRTCLAWAYDKLHSHEFSNLDDALKLDEINLLLRSWQ